MNNAAKKEEEQRIQRAAEREGRRTRRRRGKSLNLTERIVYYYFDLFSAYKKSACRS